MGNEGSAGVWKFVWNPNSQCIHACEKFWNTIYSAFALVGIFVIRFTVHLYLWQCKNYKSQCIPVCEKYEMQLTVHSRMSEIPNTVYCAFLLVETPETPLTVHLRMWKYWNTNYSALALMKNPESNLQCSCTCGNPGIKFTVHSWLWKNGIRVIQCICACDNSGIHFTIRLRLWTIPKSRSWSSGCLNITVEMFTDSLTNPERFLNESIRIP